MRILHLLAGARFGGAETIAVDTILALAEHGFEQIVIMRPHPELAERLHEGNVTVHHFGYSRIEYWINGSARVADYVHRFAPDLVQAWMGRPAMFVPPDLTVPVVGWFGGYYDLKRFNCCDYFVGMTGDIVRHLVASGVPRTRVYEVHSFGDLPAANSVMRSEFSTPKEAFVLLVLARLHPKKGIDTLIRAITSIPEAYVWVAGEGKLKKKLINLAKNLGVEDRVRFLGWRTDRRALFEAADLYVLPSIYEPFGTVIVEAWACKKPLVATKAMGALQYVSDGVDGLLVEIDDVEDLSQKIKACLMDPRLREQLVRNGEKKFRAEFSKEHVVDTWTNIYREICSRGKLRKIHTDELAITFAKQKMVKDPAVANLSGDELHALCAILLAYVSVDELQDETVAIDAWSAHHLGKVNLLRKSTFGLGRKEYILLLSEPEISQIVRDISQSSYLADVELANRALSRLSVRPHVRLGVG